VDCQIAADSSTALPLEATVAITSEIDIVIARQQGREFALRIGFSSPDAVLLATAISELARNIVMYATHGEIVLKPIDSQGRPGVLVIARDEGPGIPETLQLAIRAESPRDLMGLGLRGVRRLVDECEIVSGLGHGTTVALKKWRSES
jgi:serine/threonine-protein kinase RsbT